MKTTLFALLTILVLGAATAARAADLYVALDGKDTNPGTLERPFGTLERARDAIRAWKRAGKMPHGRITVWVHGGIYPRTASFVLTERDSGTLDSPVSYRAVQGEEVRLTGGHEVKDWSPITRGPALKRVSTRALGRVYQADLRAQGVEPAPEDGKGSVSLAARVVGLDLVFGDHPMRLSQWPNGGWARIAGAPAGQAGDRFAYEGDHPKTWDLSGGLWVHGYWTWDWADSFVKVASIDPAKREIITRPPHGVYGYTKGKRWRAVNLLEEIDEAGEWSYDRQTGMLSFWPPSPLDESRSVVSLLEAPLIAIRGASHVTLQDLTIECGLDAGVEIVGGSDNLVAGCTLRNLGTYGVWIGNGLAAGQWFDYGNPAKPRDGGERNGVSGCDIYDIGGGGIVLAGGDRQTLTPARHYAENNHIHDYGRWFRTYRAGISVDGVGARVANNKIHDAPHQAVFVNGNDNLIEYNDVSRVCLETGDAGAFYMGRDWSQRGNIVRYNYFHDLRAGGITGQSGFTEVMAVYLDDWISGTVVFGNVFYRAGRAVLIGGGRDNVVENNIFVECDPAVHVDSRGQGWAKNYFNGGETTLFDRLKLVNATGPVYTGHYPALETLLKDEPAMAKGNRVERNVRSGGRWLDLLDGLTEQTVRVKDNITEGDPGFEAPPPKSYQFTKESPVWKTGFQRIPVEKIGLYEDAYRRKERM